MESRVARDRESTMEFKPGPRDVRSWVEIDLSAVAHNIRTLKGVAGPGRLVMACVKSNAYGHGLNEVARAAEAAGADRLAVAWVDEGLSLRRAGVRVPIQVLMEPPPEAAVEMAQSGLIASLSSLGTARRMAERLDRPLTVHVEVDTGMGRVPLQPDEVPGFLARLARMGPFRVEGLFSHFSSAGEPGDSRFDRFTRDQLNAFTRLCSRLESQGVRVPIRHMAGSDGVAHYPESRLDMIRPGAWVYGYKGRRIGLDLAPVLSWKTRVLRVTPASAHRPYGYAMSFLPERDTRIAHLPVGYGDGYPRALSGVGEVLIQGMRAPVAGMIGMETMMVDVGHIEGDLEGREAVMIGRQGPERIKAADLAERIGLFGVMITCGIKEKVPRIYLGRDSRPAG